MTMTYAVFRVNDKGHLHPLWVSLSRPPVTTILPLSITISGCLYGTNVPVTFKSYI